MNDIAPGSRKDLEQKVRKMARSMFFSNEVIDEFLADATLSEVRTIERILHHQMEVRQANQLSKRMRKARFPQIKTFDDYDFSQVSFPDCYEASDLKSLAFIDEAQDFVFFGKTGRGKTHLAIATGIAAVDAGKTVRFFTVAELVMQLVQYNSDRQLDRFLTELGKVSLIVLDELGYVPLDIEGARLLYQVISNSYERQSLIITTNIEFSKWGTVFGDDKLASAAIDRIVHHGRLVEFNGASRRMDAALMLGKA